MVVPFCYVNEASTMATQQDEGTSIVSGPCPTGTEPEPGGSPVPGPSGVLTPPLVPSPPPVFSLPDIPLEDTPLLGHSFAGLAIPPKGKWDHSPSDLPDHLHIKRAHVTSPEVEVRSEQSSTQGNDHIPDLTPETRTGFRQHRQDSSSPFSSPRGLQPGYCL